MNLWQSKEPIRRLQLLDRVDFHKRHLLSLRNAKSHFDITLRAPSPSSGLHSSRVDPSQKKRYYQIHTENLRQVVRIIKAKPTLSAASLKEDYHNSLKYRNNILKTKYQSPDFMDLANQSLLDGSRGKIRLTKCGRFLEDNLKNSRFDIDSSPRRHGNSRIALKSSRLDLKANQHRDRSLQTDRQNIDNSSKRSKKLIENGESQKKIPNLFTSKLRGPYKLQIESGVMNESSLIEMDPMPSISNTTSDLPLYDNKISKMRMSMRTLR